jgi:GNAT superfamily N-acetyltransferase
VPDVTATQRSAMAQLERIAALGWRGLEEERLGDWLLRAGNRFTGRANSLLPLGDPGRPVEVALGDVVEWYSVRGLRPLIQVPLPLCSGLDEYLAASGWRAFNPSYVFAGDLASVLDSTPPRPDLPAPNYSSSPTADWLSGYRYRGAALPVGAEHVLATAADPTFLSLYEDGAVVAVARGVVDEGWLGVTAVTVDSAHRRRGLARHVMRQLTVWALNRGARRLYLQVAQENVAAVAMYRSMGLEPHHEYHYRTLDALEP